MPYDPGRAVSILTLAVFVALPALAAPADCSKGAIPPGPVKGSINGAAFAPDSVTAEISQTSMNNVTYDSYHVYFKSKAGGDFDTTAIVVKGKLPDGKTFRTVPGHDEPQAGTGAAEIQGWEVSNKAANYDQTFVFDTAASMQLAFGKRNGNSLPGQIHFCTPADKGSSLAGSFTVMVK